MIDTTLKTHSIPRLHRPSVAIISAYDSSGHAGHSCDLRTVHDLGSHGLGAITALTAQNSERVLGVNATPAETLEQQLLALQEERAAHAIKLGLIANAEQITILQRFLLTQSCPIIADPVFGSTSGTAFCDPHGIAAYRKLLPLVTLLTPNISETETLLGVAIESADDVVEAAAQLRYLGAKAVLIKGGHSDWSGPWVMDYFEDDQHSIWLRHPRQSTAYSRGTGCTLASAIASLCAQGKRLIDAIVVAEAYVQQGLRTGFALGHKGGVLGNGGWPLQLSDYPRLDIDDLPRLESPFPDCAATPLGIYPLVESLEGLEQVLAAGVTTVQLRVKNRSDAELSALIADAVALSQRYRARLFINDHWQLAIAHRAYGVHLGQEDLCMNACRSLHQAGLRLGISSHSEFEWLRAAALKPSYIAMGAVFGTQTKAGVIAIGIDNLSRWAATLAPHVPVVAIGGIDQHNIATLAPLGLSGVAVVSAIHQGGSPAEAIAQLQNLFQTPSALTPTPLPEGEGK